MGRSSFLDTIQSQNKKSDPFFGNDMSERFGPCRSCRGKGFHLFDSPEGSYQIDCMRCDGTGHSGDAIDFLQTELDKEWEPIPPQNELIRRS